MLSYLIIVNFKILIKFNSKYKKITMILLRLRICKILIFRNNFKMKINQQFRGRIIKLNNLICFLRYNLNKKTTY